ncbi:prepilin-type N-terminal cleavage/methylation domain-containing protein [Oscillatoria laete-virens NRMC-F 0139]|nr:prepilin-type N-terminal cleavage/methylation domain-containing protein [Oscillatoria laete-virens]MDL5053051.1 prepilin-type N-terminal cleavage/methylation domain-containing protein [Oscillatoria laete-virens NRMC-F 0139]
MKLPTADCQLPTGHSDSCILTPVFSLRREAFTLVELLAVIALIAILLVVAVVSLRGLGGASKMNAAANEVKLQLDSARQYARTYNTEVLVGIVSTNAAGLATNDILRVMTIYRTEKDENNVITNWAIVGNPYTLPDGVYFDTEDRSPIVLPDSGTNLFQATEMTNMPYIGSVEAEIFVMQFAPDGTLTNAPGSAFDPYDKKIIIPLIPGRRFVSGQIEGADSQTTNLAAVIEVSGQTGMSIIKRVE